MKLPRWLLVSLICACLAAPLAAAGWWWLNLPRRTAIAFADALAAGDTEAARNLMPDIDSRTSLNAFEDPPIGEVEFLDRSVGDVVRGRARFRIAPTSPHFLAERMRVQITDRTRFEEMVRLQRNLVQGSRTVDELESLRAKYLHEVEQGDLEHHDSTQQEKQEEMTRRAEALGALINDTKARTASLESRLQELVREDTAAP